MPPSPDRHRLGTFDVICPGCGAKVRILVTGKVSMADCLGCGEVCKVTSKFGAHLDMPRPGMFTASFLPGADSDEDDEDEKEKGPEDATPGP